MFILLMQVTENLVTLDSWKLGILLYDESESTGIKAYLEMSPICLVLKSARRTEANRVPKRKARGTRRRRTHHGCEAHFFAKFFKDLSHSTKHILHKQVR